MIRLEKPRMKNLINISDFNEIVKGMKAMKADLVYVKGKVKSAK